PAAIQPMPVLLACRKGVRVAEGDVTRGVLVEQRVVEDRAERPDPALAVDERELAEPSRALVRRRTRPQRLDVLVRVDLERATPFEADAEAADERRVSQNEWLGRRDMAVDPLRVGCGEDLLGRDVREVAEAVPRDEVACLPERGREEPDRELGPRPRELDRVERALVQGGR